MDIKPQALIGHTIVAVDIEKTTTWFDEITAITLTLEDGSRVCITGSYSGRDHDEVWLHTEGVDEINIGLQHQG